MGGVNILLAQTPSPDEMDDEAHGLLFRMAAADTSFFALCNMAENYLQNKPSAERFAKRYARWHHFWSNRVGNDGNIWEAKRAMQDWSNEPICTENGNWQPLTAQLCPNIQARGIVVSVYAPPCSTPPCTTPQTIYAGTNCSGLWKTTNGGNTWNCLTDNIRMPGLGVSSILVLDDNTACPEEIFIASGLTSQVDTHYGVGILKTCDGGSTWEQSLGWSSFYGDVSVKLMRDPNNANTIWALTRQKLWKSPDRGDNWVEITGIPPTFESDNPSVSPAYKNISFIDMEFLPNDPNHIVLSTRAHNVNYPYQVSLFLLVLNPAANTATYTDITPTPIAATTGNNAQQILVEVFHNPATNEDYIYALYQQVLGSTYISKAVKDAVTGTWVWQSTISTFTEGTSTVIITISEFLQVFKVHPTDNNIMYFGKRAFYRSDNEGANFSSLINTSTVIGTGTTSWHCDVRDLQIYDAGTGPNNVNLLMGNDGGVSFSTNGGTEFLNLNGEDNPNGSSLNITQFYDIANSSLQPGLVAGGTQDNSFFKYNNGSYVCLVASLCSNPTTSAMGGDGGQTIISWKNPQVIFTRVNATLKKSINGGNSFAAGSISPPAGISNFDYLDPKMLQDPLNPDVLYYAKGNKFYKIGTTPLSIATTYDFASFSDFTNVNALGVAPSNPNIIFVAAKWPGDANKLFKSVNNGSTFTDVSTLPGSNIGGQTQNNSITDIIIHPTNPQKVWIAFGGFNGYRVGHSADGGVTWSDFSAGLPGLPVNKLVYHIGSNDVMYAATDVGVYRYNPQTQVWECYNNGLPVCVVMGIEIDYCKQLLHIGTFGRGIWESPLQPIDNNTWTIDQNTTWEAGSVTNSSMDIEILPGAMLTLKGKLNLAENKRVIVQRGAKLVIEGDGNPGSDNGLLTNGCGDRHGGVEVWGNTDREHQLLFLTGADPANLDATDYEAATLNTDDPGMVILKNQARIENGRTAISTQRRGGYYPTYYGGIVYAENSSFLNNRKAVEMMQYKPFNFSHFRNCTISANTDHTIAFEGITIWDCNGIIINNCTFSNGNPAIYNNSIALTTYDAERLQVINNCHFNNVIKGIILQATNEGLGNAIISDNVFTNCRLGIQNFQTRELIARGNTFSVTAINAQHITLSGNCGYSITNNTFINGTASVAAFFTSLLTPGNNLIDCNTFQNNGTAVYANSNNSGLHFQNNDFNTLNADVQLDNNGTLPNQGQWDPFLGQFLPYFNFFTLNNPTARITTTGTTNPFFYYYHIDPSNFTLNANNRLVPHCFAGETPPFPGCPTAYNYNAIEISWPEGLPYNTCLDLNGDGFPGILPPDEECKTRECYDSLKLIIAALETQKDGGNKEELLSDLYSSPEALETYQKYLDASPYLTDQVLAEAAENALLSPTRKANILLANAPLSNDMMNTAYQHVSPTVYQMLYAIKYYFKISDRDRLDMRIGTEVQKKEALFNELFTRFQNDNDTTGMYSFLLAENTPFALRSLIGQKARYGNIDDAQTLLNSLPADTPDEQDCKTVQQINLQRLSATEGFELSEAQYQTLHSIADAYSTQAPAAQALLNLLTGEPFEWLVPTGSEKTTPIPYPQVPLIDLKTANRLWVQPNPAKEQVSISIPPFVAEKQATLYLYNTQGTSVQQIPVPYGEYQLSIPTHHLPNGVYFIRLVADGIRLANAKLVIQH
ncbi:T9SS C-terminal target domain-containing protein [Sphingobacteriales bacterium UPWRP_1]|nr:hypothetical protein B6N25_13060 [Sphingobacteriales bacterium TSM_CSS]PSJ75289.1 T9SS C-terminal target domain-containing protein [Sphingobacteriales bacterium UPWRP_1]